MSRNDGRLQCLKFCIKTNGETSVQNCSSSLPKLKNNTDTDCWRWRYHLISLFSIFRHCLGKRGKHENSKLSRYAKRLKNDEVGIMF